VRVHAVEGSSSSNGSRGSCLWRSVSGEPECDEDETLRLLHTEDYVEARGILLPATDYLRLAVEEAVKVDDLDGDMMLVVRLYIHFFCLFGN
jgi:hypothetical protein